MNIFVSAQIRETARARKAYAAFEKAGLSITHDWTTTDTIGDKRKRKVESGMRASRDINGVVNADTYVLLSDNRAVGKGMYAELGAALALHETTGSPEIYVVGPMNHLSIFYLHPAVRHVETVEQVIEDLERRKRIAA